jgi:membrane-bound lytic murein transglycosylase D
MKTLTGVFIILFFLAGCAGAGRVGTGDKVSLDQDSPTLAIDKPLKMEAGKAGSAKKAKGKVKFGIPEEDDDITALLEHDDFKDFDLPIVFNDAVKYYIVYFTTEKKKVFTNWLRRSRRYVPMIKVILKERGLPEDLVYLAMIESGFNPKAYSPAKACGPWQFIYETGGRYGLKANFWVDERKDPEKSTIAAAKYLTDLFNQFGHWYLAAAGYNAGEGRVERAIEKHNTNDFWELSKYNALPKETREYIPKLIAASIIAKDPERFGFGNIVYEEPLRFVEARVPSATLLTAIARASSMDVGTLRSLNPEILRGITPPYTEEYRIKLATTTNVALFSQRLEGFSDGERKIKDVIVYKVKKKDTIAKILKKHGVRIEELYLMNDCTDQLKLKPGMALNIPRFSGPSRENGVMVASSRPSPGDRAVAEKGRAVRQEAKAEKGRGEKQEAKVEKDRGEKQEARVEKGRAEKQEAKVEKGHEVEKSKKAEKVQTARAYHVVRKGETLSEISSMYGVEIASLVSLNNLKSEKVYPNMKLMLASHHTHKKKEGAAVARIHTVKKGETLAQISDKYGVSVASIKSANNLKTAKVHANMKLKIAGGEG